MSVNPSVRVDECAACGAMAPRVHTTDIVLPVSSVLVTVCADAGKCAERVFSRLMGRNYERLQIAVVEMALYQGRRAGICVRCGNLVGIMSDRVTHMVQGRELVHHYNCWVGLVSEKVREAIHEQPRAEHQDNEQSG